MKRSTRQLLLVLLFCILEVIIIVIASQLMASLTGSGVITMVSTYVLVILSSLLFLRLLGLRISTGNFLIGSIAAIASMSLLFAVFLAAGLLSNVSLHDEFLLILTLGAFMQLFVALGEELAFRSIIFGGLNANMGFWPAVALSTAAFALMHIPAIFSQEIDMATALVALCNIVILSIVMTLLFKYSGLLSAVAFHFFWNFLEYYLFTFGSGEGVLRLQESGSMLLTGGTFGPEASIVTLPVTAVMAVALWCYYKKKGLTGTETVKA